MSVEFYVRYHDGTEELRRDASILQEMWVLCHKIVHVLASVDQPMQLAAIKTSWSGTVSAWT